MAKIDNVTVPEHIRKENKVEIDLAGKKYQLRYPASAFVKFQEKYKGYKTAWRNMTEPYPGDVDYKVLTDFLVIGINREDMTEEAVFPLVMDLMEDETAAILVAISQASKRWLPEEVKKEGESDPTK